MLVDQARGTTEESVSVALVGPLAPPSGGMANQTEQLARLLRGSGMTVEIVQVNKPYRPRWIGGIRGVRALFRLLPYLWQLLRVTGRADLFHVMANSGWAWHLFTAPAVWMGRLRGVPVVVNYRGGEAEKFLEKQHRWICPTLSNASVVVVPSGFLQAVFAKWAVPTQTVPNIIDLSRFSPGPPDAMRLHLLVARNLEDIYDIPTAIAAFSTIHEQHAHARLTVAGSGPRRLDLLELCKRHGVLNAVTFTGRLDSLQMAHLYRTSDLLLNPSLVDNMPNSLLEAMASGIPIVTTNVGGIPFLVENETTALLVPPGDPAAMAAAALRLIDNPTLALHLRTQGLRAATAYGWPEVRPRLFGVYSLVLGRAVTSTRAPA